VSIFLGAAIGAWLVRASGQGGRQAAAGLLGLVGTFAWSRHPTAATPISR
jgi:hypothetical protein